MTSKKSFKSKINLRARGRKVNFETLENLKDLLKIDVFRRDHLIEYLHVIQDNLGYINEEYMTALAELLQISQTEVYEVATFYHHFDVIKGDEKIKCISAASILAKSSRDLFMIKLSKKYKKYKWNKNFGYGTADHLKGLKKYGITKYHRKKFKPIHNMLIRKTRETL